jgi:hypothetical protein
MRQEFRALHRKGQSSIKFSGTDSRGGSKGFQIDEIIEDPDEYMERKRERSAAKRKIEKESKIRETRAVEEDEEYSWDSDFD